MLGFIVHRIGLKNFAKAAESTISFYWFENENIGLERTRFHRIVIPFEPFDTGCDYVTQPETPVLTIEWIKLDIENPALLAGVDLPCSYHEDMEASIYIGAAHNPVTVARMNLMEIDSDRYEIEAQVEVDFEFEGVAEKERLEPVPAV